jgi:hypothetical protein
MEAMLGMAIPQWYAEHYPGDRANYTIIMFPYLFCMLINISWAVCSWTYAAKIFPITMRAKDNALMTALLWTACYAVAQATPRPQHLYRPCHQNGSIESQYRVAISFTAARRRQLHRVVPIIVLFLVE